MTLAAMGWTLSGMHALIFDKFGEPEVLQWREVPEPMLEPGQALVRVAAAGLNFSDVYRRRGNYHMDATPPWILGYEGAGEIVALGDEPSSGSFNIGDRVGFADVSRANAELVVAPLDRLIRLPTYVSFEQAAALLLQGLTAQYLASDSYSVQPGQIAVVHAAAGGVGLLLTQMLTIKGARVVALASSAVKREAARQAGAVAAFGYDEAWPALIYAQFGKGADVVYDSIGTTLPQSWEAAAIGGAVIVYGFAGGDPAPIDPRMLIDRSLTFTGGDLWNVLTSADQRTQRANQLFELFRKDALKLTIAERVSMRDGARAHRLIESRETKGKVLLLV